MAGERLTQNTWNFTPLALLNWWSGGCSTRVKQPQGSLTKTGV